MINAGRRPAVVVRAGLTALLIGASCALIAGCEKKPTASSGQVLAHVGKEDITELELENEFRWTRPPTDKRDDATVKRILGDIVLRKYLAQKAVGASIDLDPVVLLDLLREREQILAYAYVERTVARKTAATGKADIENFINSQPWRFANRKLLTVEQITVPLTPEALAAVQKTRDLKSLDETEQKLNELKILHSRSMGVLSSSEFTKEVFDEIEAKKDADQFYIRTAAAGIFFKVRGEETRPLTGAAAEGIARQALIADLTRSENNTAALAADAEVKYEGRYARIMGGVQPTGAEASDKK